MACLDNKANKQNDPHQKDYLNFGKTSPKTATINVNTPTVTRVNFRNFFNKGAFLLKKQTIRAMSQWFWLELQIRDMIRIGLFGEIGSFYE